MSLRIVRISGLSVYAGLVFNLLKSTHDGFESMPYDEMSTALLNTRAVYLNNFSGIMESLGYECSDIVWDMPIVQKTWAREHGLDSLTDLREILLRQIQETRPGILFLEGVHPLAEVDLKSLCPSVKFVVLRCGFFDPNAFAKCGGIDLFFGGTPRICRYHENLGLKTRLVYHGFDDSLPILPASLDNRKYDVTFAGSSGYGHGLTHRSRYAFLLQLFEETPLTAWLYEDSASAHHRPANPLARLRDGITALIPEMTPFQLRLAELVFRDDPYPECSLPYLRIRARIDGQVPGSAEGGRLPLYPLSAVFPARIHSPVFGLGMYEVLGASRVVFHRHGDTVGNSVGAMRLFDATGMGACLVTDSGENMKDLFEPDVELLTYGSIEECVEKVNYVLAHDNKRREIAEAGRNRTLRNHTLRKRCELIHNFLSKL